MFGCFHLPVCSYLEFLFDHHGLITMKAKLIFIFTPIPGEMIQFDYLDFLNPDTQWKVYFTYIQLPEEISKVFDGFC